MKLPDHKLVPPIALFLAGLILAVSPDSFAASIAFIASIALVGFYQYLETKKADHDQTVDSQLKELRTKVDNLILGKSLGR